jgi:hypothetical protein
MLGLLDFFRNALLDAYLFLSEHFETIDWASLEQSASYVSL